MKLKTGEIIDLSRPETFYPIHFHLSPTMLSTSKSCGQKFFYKYVKRIKPLKESASLLRGRVVHRAMQLWLMSKQSAMPGWEQYADMPIEQLVKIILWEYAYRTDDVYDAIQSRYEFPHDKRGFYSWEEFHKQMITSIFLLRKYITSRNIYPVVVNGVPAIELSLTYPLTTKIQVKNIVDMIGIDTSNGTTSVYDWKIGMRKYAVKDGISEARTNDAVISYAWAAWKSFGDKGIGLYEWPINTKIVRSVVKKSGEPSDSVETDGIIGVESFHRPISYKECMEFLDEAQISLNQISNMMLTKNKTGMCISMCDYSSLCLMGTTDGYAQVVEVEDEDSDEGE